MKDYGIKLFFFLSFFEETLRTFRDLHRNGILYLQNTDIARGNRCGETWGCVCSLLEPSLKRAGRVCDTREKTGEREGPLWVYSEAIVDVLARVGFLSADVILRLNVTSKLVIKEERTLQIGVVSWKYKCLHSMRMSGMEIHPSVSQRWTDGVPETSDLTQNTQSIQTSECVKLYFMFFKQRKSLDSEDAEM